MREHQYAKVVVAAISLVLFFVVVLYFCLRDRRRDPTARSDDIELMRKSPFGRWRY